MTSTLLPLLFRPADPVTGLSSLEVVVLHPDPPEGVVLALGAMGPTRVVRGSPADRRTLEAAGAAQARWGGGRTRCSRGR